MVDFERSNNDNFIAQRITTMSRYLPKAVTTLVFTIESWLVHRVLLLFHHIDMITRYYSIK